MTTVLVTGASGMIGTALTQVLLQQGHAVRHLGRKDREVRGVRSFTWGPSRGEMDPEAMHGVDHIIHLAGAGIGDRRWTPRRVDELIQSRAGTARLLLRCAQEHGIRPRSFISAAGIGWYGAVTSDRIHTEDDPPGTDTIARISHSWEEAVMQWEPLCRTVRLRTAVVLSTSGGALPKLLLPVRLGLGAAMGSGRQWIPWVHIDDVVAAYVHALSDDRMHGPYNLAASEHATNASLMRTAAKLLGRPFFLPNVPAFMLTFALGGMASVLLEGSRVDNERIRRHGFRFEHHGVEEALRSLLRTER